MGAILPEPRGLHQLALESVHELGSAGALPCAALYTSRFGAVADLLVTD
eukprot:COSAG05_NODE_1596_length_4455_cov_3.362259_3_plen_49_part_00